MDNTIDMRGVIARLKRELGLNYDTELSEKLGKDRKYISVIKGRGTFGGEIWIKIFNIAKDENISLDWLIHGKMGQGMDPEEIIKSTIEQAAISKDARNKAVQRLSEVMVSYQSMPDNNKKEKVTDLAIRLINALMSDD